MAAETPTGATSNTARHAATGRQHHAPDPSGPIHDADGNVAVTSATCQDLVQGSTYHFRLVVTNPNGAGYGADQSFKPQGPPEINGVGVSEVNTDGATDRAPRWIRPVATPAISSSGDRRPRIRQQLPDSGIIRLPDNQDHPDRVARARRPQPGHRPTTSGSSPSNDLGSA